MRLKPVFFAFIFLLVIGLAPLLSAAQNGHVVYVAKISGTITDYTVDQFARYINIAERNRAEALIIEFNTPGGLGDAMMKIVSEIQNSTVPVIIYVAPPGCNSGLRRDVYCYGLSSHSDGPGNEHRSM